MKIVICKWRDTIQDPSWAGHEDLECPVIETIGWEVFRDDETIKIGNTKDQETPANVSGICAIPIGCVISCHTIHDS